MRYINAVIGPCRTAMKAVKIKGLQVRKLIGAMNHQHKSFLRRNSLLCSVLEILSGHLEPSLYSSPPPTSFFF